MTAPSSSRAAWLTRGRLRRLLLGWAALCVALFLGAYFAFRIAPAPAPSEAARRWALETLGGVDAPSPPPDGVEGERSSELVVALAWREGRVLGRHVSEAGLERAVTDARVAFADLRGLEGIHFTLALVEGEGPLVRGVPLLSPLGIVPMREGILARYEGRLVLRTPDELLAAAAYDAGVATFIPDLQFGVNLDALVAELAAELGISADELDARGEVRRFRSTTLAEHDYPRDVPVDESSLVEASVDGARFLLRHQRATGRYTYLYDATSGSSGRSSGYSLPRHSGTTFFLAQVDRVVGMPEARTGALRALRWIMARRMGRCGGEEIDCIRTRRGQADVGSAALTVVAAAEVLAKAPDPMAERMVIRLTAFLRSMQREDGELMHYYDVTNQRPIDVQTMYYSGEAAFALIKAYRVLGDERNLEAARRLMGHLTGKGWNFLGSRYYYGEEHWTCIAAGEARDLIDSEEALDFCRRWYEWNDALQYREGDTPWSSAGAYGVGPILLPRLTAIGSRSEAFIGTYELFRSRGVETDGIREVIERGLGGLLRWRWAPGPVHLFASPELAHGGVPGTPAELESRNDFVQHAGSAWIRWVEVLRRERAEAGR